MEIRIVAGELPFAFLRGQWIEDRGQRKCHSCETCPRESREQESRKQKSEVGGQRADDKLKMTNEKFEI